MSKVKTTFSVGDVVKLKGSAMLMTVEKFPDSSVVWCVWFDDTQKVQRGVFPSECIIKAATK